MKWDPNFLPPPPTYILLYMEPSFLFMEKGTQFLTPPPYTNILLYIGNHFCFLSEWYHNFLYPPPS